MTRQLRQGKLRLAEGMVCSWTGGMKANCLWLYMARSKIKGEEAGRGPRKWVINGLEYAKKFELDPKINGKHEGEEPPSQIGHLGSSMC